MTSFDKNTLFKPSKPRVETMMDKTTRAVAEILDEETELRRVKTDRLRKARIEREAHTPVDPPKPTSASARKKPRANP